MSSVNLIKTTPWGTSNKIDTSGMFNKINTWDIVANAPPLDWTQVTMEATQRHFF
jgi:hypothetical protein